MSTELAVNGHDAFSVATLTKEDARELVEKIRSHIADARGLVLDLYERGGWRALGYDSWRECVVAEFEQSQSRLYQLLEVAKVERNLSNMLEKPLSTRAAHVLKTLEPAAQREAWQTATAGNPNPTAAQVKRAVKTVRCVPREELTEREKEELEKSHRQVSTQLFADAVSLFDPRIMTVDGLAAHLLGSIDAKETREDLSKPRLERALEVFTTIVANWK